MKKLAALLACVLALSLGLTACGGSSASGSTTSAAATSGEKQLVVQLGPDPETLDPALNSAIDGANMILFAFDTPAGCGRGPERGSCPGRELGRVRRRHDLDLPSARRPEMVRRQ